MADGRNLYSPLRYPGGKACLTKFLSDLADLNNLRGGAYLELYAGGSGAALNLLFEEVFSQIHINDFDYHIYAMWHSILNDSGAFIRKIKNTPINIDEWHRQQVIYDLERDADIVDAGFATFFLNRTNRSGIIFKAGPIGGLDQRGTYKIDVRFNKTELINRIEKISQYRQQIQLTNLDALTIIDNLTNYHPNTDNLFAYLDPPYYQKGRQLYLNNYLHDDHQDLARSLANLDNVHWLVSYDDADPIKAIFSDYRMANFTLNYTLQSKTFNKELLIFSPNLLLPPAIRVYSRVEELVLI